jgi:hypothetical protein
MTDWHLISDSEKAEFEEAIREAGFRQDEFLVEAVEDPLPRGYRSGQPYRVNATVTVRRRSAGIERQYRDEFGSPSWVLRFGDELKAGLFGRP